MVRVNIDKVKKDILKIESKKEEFYKEYPRTYKEIAKKYGITMQYVFKIRKQLVDLPTFPRVGHKR